MEVLLGMVGVIVLSSDNCDVNGHWWTVAYCVTVYEFEIAFAKEEMGILVLVQ